MMHMGYSTPQIAKQLGRSEGSISYAVSKSYQDPKQQDHYKNWEATNNAISKSLKNRRNN